MSQRSYPPPPTRYGTGGRPLQAAKTAVTAAAPPPKPPPTRYGAIQRTEATTTRAVAPPVSRFTAPPPVRAPRPAAPHMTAAIQRSAPPRAGRPVPAGAGRSRGVVQGLILYLQNDSMHQSDAEAMAKGFFSDEAYDYWGNVLDLRTNRDSTLTLLGHAGLTTFGGLTASSLVTTLIGRDFDKSTHTVLELVGCAATATPARDVDTFADQVQTLLKAERMDKTVTVKGLKQPSAGKESTLFRFANGKFVYVTGTQEEIALSTQRRDTQARIYTDPEIFYNKFIEMLKAAKISYVTDKFKNIRGYLSTPTPKVTHKGGSDSLNQLLIAGYES